MTFVSAACRSRKRSTRRFAPDWAHAPRRPGRIRPRGPSAPPGSISPTPCGSRQISRTTRSRAGWPRAAEDLVVVDANVLLYAVDTESGHHEASRAWLDTSLAGAEGVGLAWIALLAFVRIGTNPTIFP